MKTLNLQITGMTCASCAAVIQREFDIKQELKRLELKYK